MCSEYTVIFGATGNYSLFELSTQVEFCCPILASRKIVDDPVEKV